MEQAAIGSHIQQPLGTAAAPWLPPWLPPWPSTLLHSRPGAAACAAVGCGRRHGRQGQAPHPLRPAVPSSSRVGAAGGWPALLARMRPAVTGAAANRGEGWVRGRAQQPEALRCRSERAAAAAVVEAAACGSVGAAACASWQPVGQVPRLDAAICTAGEQDAARRCCSRRRLRLLLCISGCSRCSAGAALCSLLPCLDGGRLLQQGAVPDATSPVALQQKGSVSKWLRVSGLTMGDQGVQQRQRQEGLDSSSPALQGGCGARGEAVPLHEPGKHVVPFKLTEQLAASMGLLSPARSLAGARWPGTTVGRSSPPRQSPGSCRRHSSSPTAGRCGPTARGEDAAACAAQRSRRHPPRRCFRRRRCSCRLPAAEQARPTGAESGHRWQRPAGGRRGTTAPCSQADRCVPGALAFVGENPLEWR